MNEKNSQKTINFSQNLTFCEKGMNLTIGRWELFASIELYGRPGKIWPKNSDWFLFQNDWFFLGVIWAYNSLWKKLVRAKTNQIENILFRDLQTKTDRSKDQEKISDRTRTKQILKISDQFGPVGSRTRWSVYPWSYWSNCCHVQYRQCIIAVCMEWLNYHVKWFNLSGYSDGTLVRVSAYDTVWSFFLRWIYYRSHSSLRSNWNI